MLLFECLLSTSEVQLQIHINCLSFYMYNGWILLVRLLMMRNWFQRGILSGCSELVGCCYHWELVQFSDCFVHWWVCQLLLCSSIADSIYGLLLLCANNYLSFCHLIAETTSLQSTSRAGYVNLPKNPQAQNASCAWSPFF